MVRAIRDRDVVKCALVMVFPLTYFYVIATKDLIFGRYLLPIVPFLCILMAIAIVDVLDWASLLRQPQWLRPLTAAAFVGLALFHLVHEGVMWPKEHGRRTTQDVAYKMIRQFIPEHSRVAVEVAGLRLPDTLYRADLVRELTARSPAEYAAAGVRFLVASSDRFGPAYARPDQYRNAYQAYHRLLDEDTECLPTVEPTAAVPGPRIRICRFLAR